MPKGLKCLTLYHTIPTLNQHFLLFPQCFLPFTKQISFFQPGLFCHLQMLSIWTSLKFCRLVELRTPWHGCAIARLQVQVLHFQGKFQVERGNNSVKIL